MMIRNYQIIVFLLTLLVLVSCSNSIEEKGEQVTRIDPYETPDASEEEVESNHVTPLKSELPQIELRDERKANPEIDSLLKIVELAIAQKDVDLLLTAMDTNIISSYGGGMYGHEDFRHVWGDDYQKLWDKLDKLLKLGGTLENDSLYCIPYTGNVNMKVMVVDDEIMPYACGISTHTDTKLYPSIESNEDEAIEIGRTYCIIQEQDDRFMPINNFWKINVLGTKVLGYVNADDFYVSADYGLAIEKNAEGNWKITAFAPWD